MDPQLHTDTHRLEEALGIKIYPGTEVLKDVEGVEFVKGNSGVLVPQPSSDPADPLNWSKFWKAGALTNAILLGFMQGFGPLSLSSQVPYYVRDFDCSVNQVINFIGVTILVLGFSNFLWVPVATQFGRRPAALLSNIICLGSCIWRAKATTYHSFYKSFFHLHSRRIGSNAQILLFLLGACVLNGIGAGPAETLPPMIIADCMFLNTRGTWMGIYWFGYFGSLMVGPVVSGSISERWGWQSFWWLNVAMFGVLILLQLVWQPETLFKRTEESFETVVSDKEKDGASSAQHIEKHVDEELGHGKPSMWQWSPIQAYRGSKKSLFNDLFTPWLLFTFPIVEWASFTVSWSSSCFLYLNLTQSFVFAAPPYNFSPAAVGYTNLAVLGGAILGVATGGPGGDWLSAFLTRRNKMIREPEMRLPALWPFCLLCLIGTTVVAVGYERHWDWKVIVIVGYGLIGWQVASIPALAISYTVDCYKPVSGEFLVAATVNKNVWGYGVSQFLIPWILKKGFIEPFMVNVALTMVFAAGGSILLYAGGKRVRGWSKNSFVHRMEVQ